MTHLKKVAIFSGGRGATNIIGALHQIPNVEMALVVNAYDDGRSTGMFRRLIPGFLGPSDIRKNFSHLIPGALDQDRSLKKILEYRFPADLDAAAGLKILHRLCETELKKNTVPLELYSYFVQGRGPNIQYFKKCLLTCAQYLESKIADLSFADASLGNFILAGSFLNNGNNFNQMVADMAKNLPLQGHVWNVTGGENRFLLAVKEDGSVLWDEASIVEQKSTERIRELFLLDTPIMAAQEKKRIEALDLEAKLTFFRSCEQAFTLQKEVQAYLENADYIVFAPGTQFSSLYPTYLTPGIAEALRANQKAKKIFISNIGEDSEIPNATVGDLVKWATYYLNQKSKLAFGASDFFNIYLVNRLQRLSGVRYVKFKETDFPDAMGKVMQLDLESAEDPGKHHTRKLLSIFLQILEQEEMNVGSLQLLQKSPKVISIVIPAYNEERYIGKLIPLIEAVDLSDFNLSKEIIVVDDGSKDNTAKIAQGFSEVKTFIQEKNGGKGSAVRRGIQESTGDFILIQDADLEYNPADYRQMVEFCIDHDFKAVYGSRVLKHESKHRHLSILFGKRRGAYWGHYIGGQVLSLVTFLLYGRYLTDTVTAYKLYDASLLKSITLRTSGFELDHEITAKVLRKGVDIYEVPISYTPRSFAEGKKITWKDGVRAIKTLARFRFFY